MGEPGIDPRPPYRCRVMCKVAMPVTLPVQGMAI